MTPYDDWKTAAPELPYDLEPAGQCEQCEVAVDELYRDKTDRVARCYSCHEQHEFDKPNRR